MGGFSIKGASKGCFTTIYCTSKERVSTFKECFEALTRPLIGAGWIKLSWVNLAESSCISSGSMSRSLSETLRGSTLFSWICHEKSPSKCWRKGLGRTYWNPVVDINACLR